MAGRPPTSMRNRPPSNAAGRPSSGMRLGTGRPGTRSGQGGAGNSVFGSGIKVEDRYVAYCYFNVHTVNIEPVVLCNTFNRLLFVFRTVAADHWFYPRQKSQRGIAMSSASDRLSIDISHFQQCRVHFFTNYHHFWFVGVL